MPKKVNFFTVKLERITTHAPTMLSNREAKLCSLRCVGSHVLHSNRGKMARIATASVVNPRFLRVHTQAQKFGETLGSNKIGPGRNPVALPICEKIVLDKLQPRSGES